MHVAGPPHGALIFVGDGRKALFLRNEGDALAPGFVTVRVFKDDNPASHVQGSDRPGRAFAAAGAVRRSAVQETDWHELEEHRFVERAAAALEALARTDPSAPLILVAPPRALADLRAALRSDIAARVRAEFDKDLTKMPIEEIEARICADFVAR